MRQRWDLPFERRQPDYAPLDEAHMYPETSYALSKVVGEELARQFHRWSGIPFIGLRFSNVMVREDYERFPGFQDDPHLRKWNLWGYVDESHVAHSVRCALAADLDGAENFIIAAADTVMERPSRELMAEVLPARARRRHASRATTPCLTSPRRAGCSVTTRSSAGASSPSSAPGGLWRSRSGRPRLRASPR